MVRYRLPLLLGVLAALSVVVRLPFFGVPLISDEAGYAYVAHWLDRGLSLYRDLWFDRPQGIFIVYGAILHLFGESTEAIRLGAAVYNAFTVVLLYHLGAALLGRRAGAVAAAVFAAASASPIVEGFTANGELFMNLPVVACLLLVVWRRPFLAGVVLAVATAIKPTALPTCGLAIVAWLAWQRRAAGKPGMWLGAGFAAGALPFAAHGIAADAQTYWYSVVGFRVQAHSIFSVGVEVLQDLWATGLTVVVGLLPVWLLAAGAVVRGGWRERGVAFSTAFLGGAAAGAAAGGYWYWHYYLGLLPAAALLSGAGAVRAATALRRAYARVRTAGVLPALVTRSRSGAFAAAVVAGALAAVALNVRVVGATPEETSWNLYRRPAYLASKQIAAYLRARTSPSDAIYVAFAQADVYYLSGRRSAGRQLYWTEINRVPGAFESVLAALDDPGRRPKYVVQVDDELEQPGRAAAFWARVHALYREETTIGRFTLYRLKDPVEQGNPAGVAGGAGA